jgi:hypothetical protein
MKPNENAPAAVVVPRCQTERVEVRLACLKFAVFHALELESVRVEEE